MFLSSMVVITSCFAFEGRDLHKDLDEGLLKNGCVFFDDNTYLNIHTWHHHILTFLVLFPIKEARTIIIFATNSFVFVLSVLLVYLLICGESCEMQCHTIFL